MTSPNQIIIPPPSLDDVLYERRENFAVITLNRPVVLNAVNWSISRRLAAALDQLDADDEVRAVILTGAGRSFCAGGDIQSTPPEDGLPSPSMVELVQRMWNNPRPFIAAVRGHAVGQGCEIAGMMDITIAADDAKFGEIQIRHGFGPPMLITPFLLGLKKAKEMMMLGEMVDAQEALRIGYVNKVVPGDKLMDEAEAMARKLGALPPRTVQGNKILVNRSVELAGMRESFNYREDPVYMAVASPGERENLNDHLKVLREQGWEAFRESRDALYR